MIKTDLTDNIKTFVERIGVVLPNQIFELFQKHNKETIQWCITSLVARREILQQEENGALISRYPSRISTHAQDALTQAAWLMISFGEDKIREYWPADYPCQLLFVTDDDRVYDITVFDWNTIKSIPMVILQQRKGQFPVGVEDEIIHLALVPDKSLGAQIEPFGFDSFCVLDENNRPLYYQWED